MALDQERNQVEKTLRDAIGASVAAHRTGNDADKTAAVNHIAEATERMSAFTYTPEARQKAATQIGLDTIPFRTTKSDPQNWGREFLLTQKCQGLLLYSLHAATNGSPTLPVPPWKREPFESAVNITMGKTDWLHHPTTATATDWLMATIAQLHHATTPLSEQLQLVPPPSSVLPTTPPSEHLGSDAPQAQTLTSQLNAILSAIIEDLTTKIKTAPHHNKPFFEGTNPISVPDEAALDRLKKESGATIVWTLYAKLLAAYSALTKTASTKTFKRVKQISPRVATTILRFLQPNQHVAFSNNNAALFQLACVKASVTTAHDVKGTPVTATMKCIRFTADLPPDWGESNLTELTKKTARNSGALSLLAMDGENKFRIEVLPGTTPLHPMAQEYINDKSPLVTLHNPMYVNRSLTPETSKMLRDLSERDATFKEFVDVAFDKLYKEGYYTSSILRDELAFYFGAETTTDEEDALLASFDEPLEDPADDLHD